MKVVVVGLSGDLNEGCRRLAEHFPTAHIETASREELQTGSLLSRLAALRARIPEVFALVTERLAWQRGQEALLLFGTLAGARRTIILDEFGGWREETRARILMRSPVRLLSEISVSRNVMRRAARELTRLEAGVAGSNIYSRHLGNHRAPKIVYLRATPGPGTQIGGAASHINGFINAATRKLKQVGSHTAAHFEQFLASMFVEAHYLRHPRRVLLITMTFYFVKELSGTKFMITTVHGAGGITTPLCPRALLLFFKLVVGQISHQCFGSRNHCA